MSYTWLDSFEQQQSLMFSLPKNEVQDQFRNLTQYRPEIAQRYVYIELMRQAQMIDPKEARIDLKRIGQEIKISVRSRSTDMLEKWKSNMAQMQQEAFEDYLRLNYYIQFKTHLGQNGVKPDHVRYMRESRDLLLPVAQAIYDKLDGGSDSRDYVNLLISWVQSIPYNELQDRLVSNGSGYSPPLEVISNNLGDCDSKTTLTAGLMRSLLPKLSMVIIYLPGHALLGANLSHRENEQYLTINGMDYLLIEPTGPAIMRVGQIADSSMQDLASGMYNYEVVP